MKTSHRIILIVWLLFLAVMMGLACFWDYQDRQQIAKLTAALNHAEAKLRNISAVLSIPGIKIVPKMTDMAKYHGGYEIWKPFAGDGGLNIIHDIYQYRNAFFAFHDGFNENKGNMVWGDGTDGDEFLKAYEAHRSPGILLDDYSKLPDDTKPIKQAERAAGNPKRDFIAACRAHNMVALFVGPKGKEDYGWCAKKITPEVVP